MHFIQLLVLLLFKGNKQHFPVFLLWGDVSAFMTCVRAAQPVQKRSFQPSPYPPSTPPGAGSSRYQTERFLLLREREKLPEKELAFIPSRPTSAARLQHEARMSWSTTPLSGQRGALSLSCISRFCLF